MAKKKKKKDDEKKKFEYSNEVIGIILILASIIGIEHMDLQVILLEHLLSFSRKYLYIFINEFIITWRISNIKRCLILVV